MSPCHIVKPKRLLQLLLAVVVVATQLTAGAPSNPGYYHFTQCNKEQLQQVANLADVRTLIADDCNITTLSNAFFMRFTNLIELEITDSQLSTMEDYALHGLLRLKSLSLARNNLTEVKSWSNQQLSALVSLDLRRNGIRELTLKSFQRYPNLQRLNLALNLLEDIDEGIFRWMPHLKYLNLGRNRLKMIDERNFHGMHRLVQLALYSNQIVHIDSDAFQSNTHLRSLRLEGNQVVDLDFLRDKALTRLIYLNLSHNLVDTLQVLDFNAEYELTQLDVSYNRVTQVLVDTFAGLEAIQHLNISNNALHLIEPSSFADLVNLQSIDLSCNNLTQLPPDIWHNLTQLQRINLSHNALPSIDAALFAQQPQLYALDLSHNQLQDGAFIEQLAPELNRVALSLYLGDNHYERLNISSLKDFRRVVLAGNRWHCRWLIGELLHAPPTIHFGRNFTVASSWSAALLEVSSIECYDEQRQRSVVVLDATRMWERRQKAGQTLECGLFDAAEPTPPPLVWPRVKMDKFDSRSIIIWMLLAIALAFAGLRIARQLIDGREKRRRARKLREQELELNKAHEVAEDGEETETAPPYEADSSSETEQSEMKKHKTKERPVSK